MYPLDPPIILNDTELVITWSEPSSLESIPATGFLLRLSGVLDEDIEVFGDTFDYIYNNLCTSFYSQVTV